MVTSTLLEQRSAQSLCINRVRVIFAILLVIRHAFMVDALPSMHIEDYFILGNVKSLIMAFLSDLIVPVYFFISGYLFFFNVDSLTRDVYITKLRKRIKTILVPYILWNAIGVILVFLKSMPIFSSFLSYQGTELNVTFFNILSCFWMYDGQLSPPPIDTENYADFVTKTFFPINTALWYMRDLMIVTLCVPIIAWLLRRMKGGFVVLLLSLYVLFSFWYVNWHINQLLTAFFFFSWGAYLSMNSKNILSSFKPYTTASVVIYIICSLGYFFVADYSSELAQILKLINTLIIVIFAFNVVAKIPQEFLKKQIGNFMRFCLYGALFSFTSYFKSVGKNDQTCFRWSLVRCLYFRYHSNIVIVGIMFFLTKKIHAIIA